MPAQDSIGLTGPDYEMDVERGRIRDFARAMSAPLPEFTSGRTPLIPASFLVTTPYTWGYSLERPRGTVFGQIDHDLSVPLHAEESFVFHRGPPRAGDQFTCRSILENVVTKSGGRGGDLTFLTLLTEYRDGQDIVVVEQRSVTVTTANAPNEDGWDIDLPVYEPDYPDLDPGDNFSGISRVCWEALRVGDGPGQIDTGPLMLRDIVRFQGVVGEDNALHYDLAWAEKSGFPGGFGLGIHQASMLVGYAAHWIDPATVRSFRARFRNVYWPGDQLVYQGVVSRKYLTESGDCTVGISLSCTRLNGDPVVDVVMSHNLGPDDPA